MKPSDIDPSAIKNLLSTEFDFFCGEIGVHRIEAGVENINYYVENDDRKYILRIYNEIHTFRGNRSQQSIEVQFLLMERAREHGILVPTVIQNRDGRSVGSTGIDGRERFFTLFEYIDGESPKKADKEVVQKMASIVSELFDVGAELHIMDEQDFGIVSRAFEKYDKLVGLRRNSRIKPDERLKNLNRKVRRDSPDVRKRHLSTGVMHGDIHLENLLFSKEKKLLAVLDFDDYRYGYLIEEAAMALMHNLYDVEKNILRSGNYDNFIEGISNDRLKAELAESLTFFLKARLLYCMSKESLAGNYHRVEELWEDRMIQKHVLEATPLKFRLP